MSDAELGLNADQARRITDQIKVAVEGAWLLIREAYETRAWAALGYTSWDDYCTREFGSSRLRLPRGTDYVDGVVHVHDTHSVAEFIRRWS